MVAARQILAGLLGRSLGQTLDEISQQQPPTAGGSSAALAGALAAALTSMVSRSARERWVDAGGAIAQAEALRARLCALAASDAEAYGQARALLLNAGRDRERRGIAAAPGVASREREQREYELACALAVAAAEPVAIAEAAANVAALAAWSVEAGGADERPDAIVAVCLAEAAACGAAQLVLANLAIRPADELATRAQVAARVATERRERALADDRAHAPTQ